MELVDHSEKLLDSGKMIAHTKSTHSFHPVLLPYISYEIDFVVRNIF